MSAIQEQSFCNTHLMGHCFQKMFSPYFRVAGFPTVLFSILWNNALLFSFFPFLPLSPAFPFLFHCIIVATLRGSLSSGQQLRRFRKSPDYYDFNFPLYVYPSRGSTVLSLQLGFFYDVTFSCVHWVEILVRKWYNILCIKSESWCWCDQTNTIKHQTIQDSVSHPFITKSHFERIMHFDENIHFSLLIWCWVAEAEG